MKNITVIIPSLDPDERLSSVVDSLKQAGFCDFVLVNDGSKPENVRYFPGGDDITLLTHPENKGKGAALKTALDFVIKNKPDAVGVLTCDGDGQHLAKDAVNVAKKMLETGNFILGVRDFSLPDVPPKSRIGNRLSSILLALCSGNYISDTQTGLRAIPKDLFEPMSKVEGARFEYETNVLLSLKKMKASYNEVKIETVYLNENKGTHFHPVKDTLRIFSRIIKYSFSSAAAFLTDILLFTLLHSKYIALGVISSTVIARLVSSVINFVLNKSLVFHSDSPLLKTLIKYYSIAIPVMFISAFGVKGLTLVLRIPESSFATTVLKVVIDCILFIANYNIQKKWIFKLKKQLPKPKG